MANNPLTLSQISVCFTSSKTSVTKANFGHRSHFALSKGIYILKSSMMFANNNYPKQGCCRIVAISLVNNEEVVVSSVKKTIRIAKGRERLNSKAVLPFIYNNVESDSEYTLVVRDISSGSVIAEKKIRFYNIDRIGCSPQKWYDVFSGGIIPEWSYDTFKSIKDVNDLVHTIRFSILPCKKNTMHVLPELEMKIYFPNRTIDTYIVEPQLAAESNINFFVETRFKIDYMHWGNCYVKLLCMGYPIAGFAFSTAGPTIAGEWKGSELAPINKYSGPIAAKKIYDANPFACKLEEEFDKLFDEFIESQKEM